MNKIIIGGVVYNAVEDNSTDCPNDCALSVVCGTSGASPCLLYIDKCHFEEDMLTSKKMNILEAAKDYAKYVNKHGEKSICTSDAEAFEAGTEWQKQQNPWRNFKDERPKSDSHILRKMIHPGYQAYGKVIYYADFWNSDRPDEWKQEDDRVVYEWQYIND